MIYVIDSNDEDFKKIWCFDYKEKFLNEYKIMTTEEHMILYKKYNCLRIILLINSEIKNDKNNDENEKKEKYSDIKINEEKPKEKKKKK